MQPVGPPSDQPLKVDRKATRDSLKRLLAETDDKSEYAGQRKGRNSPSRFAVSVLRP